MIRARLVLGPLLAAMVISAGCLGGEILPSQDAADASQPAPTSANDGSTLVVEVTSPTVEPIADANVSLETEDGVRHARTGSAGTARLRDLPAGPAILTVQAEGFQGRQLQVELADEGTERQRVLLRWTLENGTHVERFAFEGFFECSATYLIITGDCLAPARALAEAAGLDPETNATNRRYVFRFPIHEGWSTIRIRQTWEDPAAGAGSMMRINLEPVDPNGTRGHSPQYAEAEGQSPIELRVEEGQVHPTASSEEMLVPEQGGWLRTRTFHLGLAEAHHPAGTSFLGVGAAVQQPFTVTVEVVYG